MTPPKILLQTTIPYLADDWHIGRFSLLKSFLANLKNAHNEPAFEVITRDKEISGDDSILSMLAESDFAELWLFAVDTGDGLSTAEAAAINAFRERGGGILITRDHQDLGSCLCGLDEIGKVHYFHTRNPDPEPSRNQSDDSLSTNISWPNYHSGLNGDYQEIKVCEPVHPLLKSEDGERLHFFPAHPHEGGIGVEEGGEGRVIAKGISKVTDTDFNLIIAFEGDSTRGRAIAESSFHHFCDYNWDISLGCPSFVSEPPGDGYQKHPSHLIDIKTYVRNAAFWLAGLYP
ncbi:MAG: hypothetical protein SFT81_03995 [Candidatus Caenarcaniphilales bacterium]|nr:hypothetical protein [Candidatus Caenarcaniphilales bacterium]